MKNFSNGLMRWQNNKLNMRLTKILIAISILITLFGCTFKGDGKFEKHRAWLFFIPVDDYRVSFDSFDLSHSHAIYKFINICSWNNSANVYVRLRSSTLHNWNNEPGSIQLKLIRSDNKEIMNSSINLNDKRFYQWHGMEDESYSWYQDVMKGLPTNGLLIEFSSNEKLGCSEYMLSVNFDQNYPVGAITTEIWLDSYWE